MLSERWENRVSANESLGELAQAEFGKSGSTRGTLGLALGEPPIVSTRDLIRSFLLKSESLTLPIHPRPETASSGTALACVPGDQGVRPRKEAILYIETWLVSAPEPVFRSGE